MSRDKNIARHTGLVPVSSTIKSAFQAVHFYWIPAGVYTRRGAGITNYCAGTTVTFSDAITSKLS